MLYQQLLISGFLLHAQWSTNSENFFIFSVSGYTFYCWRCSDIYSSVRCFVSHISGKYSYKRTWQVCLLILLIYMIITDSIKLHWFASKTICLTGFTSNSYNLSLNFLSSWVFSFYCLVFIIIFWEEGKYKMQYIWKVIFNQK